MFMRTYPAAEPGLTLTRKERRWLGKSASVRLGLLDLNVLLMNSGSPQ
jgi:hypothetical protein